MKLFKTEEVEVQDDGLENLVEFPTTGNYEFKLSMQTHFQNLFLSYGKERVLRYLMETEGLEPKQVRAFFGKVG